MRGSCSAPRTGSLAPLVAAWVFNLNAPGVAACIASVRDSMSRRDQRAHLAVGDRLLSDARRPARVEGSISVDISAAAPLGDLDLAAARLRRIALSAGFQAGSIADASELDEGLMEAIEALPAGWVRDLNLAARVRAGLERGLGLGSARHDVDATTDAALGATANSIADRLAKAARQLLVMRGRIPVTWSHVTLCSPPPTLLWCFDGRRCCGAVARDRALSGCRAQCRRH